MVISQHLCFKVVVNGEGEEEEAANPKLEPLFEACELIREPGSSRRLAQSLPAADFLPANRKHFFRNSLSFGSSGVANEGAPKKLGLLFWGRLVG